MFVFLDHLYLERKEVFAEFSFRLVLNLIPSFLHVLLDLPEMLARSLRMDTPELCQRAPLDVHLPLLHADPAESLLVPIS